MKTVFEKIIDGEIPATKVYEDDTCVAFMDISPQTKGHLLLVPKEKVGRIQFVPDDLLTYLVLKSKELIISMIAGLQCDYVQVEIVGIGVPDHFHIHLIPRMNEEHIPESEHKKYEEGEMAEIAEKIKSSLQAPLTNGAKPI